MVVAAVAEMIRNDAVSWREHSLHREAEANWRINDQDDDDDDEWQNWLNWRHWRDGARQFLIEHVVVVDDGCWCSRFARFSGEH